LTAYLTEKDLNNRKIRLSLQAVINYRTMFSEIDSMLHTYTTNVTCEF